MANSYSPSAINTYLQCQLKFYYDKIEEKYIGTTYVENIMGTIVHAVLEDFYNYRANYQTEQDIVNTYNVKWEQETAGKSILINNSFQTLEDYKKRGLSFVTHYYNQYKDETITWSFYAEEIMIVPVAGHDFTFLGIIDRLDAYPGGIYKIHDYKTYAKAKSKTHYETDIQLATYAFMLEDHAIIKGWTPVTGDVTLLWNVQDPESGEIYQATVTKTPAQRAELKAKVIDLIANQIEPKRIKNNIDDFKASPRSDTCRYCIYNKICKERNAKPIQNRSFDLNALANVKTCAFRVGQSAPIRSSKQVSGKIESIRDDNIIMVRLDETNNIVPIRLAGVSIPSPVAIQNNFTNDGISVMEGQTIDNPALGNAAARYLKQELRRDLSIQLDPFVGAQTEDLLNGGLSLSQGTDKDGTVLWYMAYIFRSGEDFGHRVITDGYGVPTITGNADKDALYRQSSTYAIEGRKGLWSAEYLEAMAKYQPIDKTSINTTHIWEGVTPTSISSQADEYLANFTATARSIHAKQTDPLIVFIESPNYIIGGKAVNDAGINFKPSFLWYKITPHGTGNDARNLLDVYLPAPSAKRVPGWTRQYAQPYFRKMYWYISYEYLKTKGMQINAGSIRILDESGAPLEVIQIGNVDPSLDGAQHISTNLIREFESGMRLLRKAIAAGEPNVGEHCATCLHTSICPANKDTLDKIGRNKYRRTANDISEGFKTSEELRDNTEDENMLRFLEVLFEITHRARLPIRDRYNTELLDSYNEYKMEQLLALRERKKIIDEMVAETDLQIGAVHCRATVTKVMMRDMKEYTLADTLRSSHPMIARKDSANHSATIEVIFTGETQINTELRHIIAQARTFPYLQIRNDALSRTMVPIDTHMDFYYFMNPALIRTLVSGVEMERITKEGRDPAILRAVAKNVDKIGIMNRLYRESLFMYAVRGIAVTPMPGKVDTISLRLDLQLMDLETVTETGGIRFIYDTLSASEQLAWQSHYHLAKSWRDMLSTPLDDSNGTHVRKSIEHSIGYYDGDADLITDSNVVPIDYTILNGMSFRKDDATAAQSRLPLYYSEFVSFSYEFILPSYIKINGIRGPRDTAMMQILFLVYYDNPDIDRQKGSFRLLPCLVSENIYRSHMKFSTNPPINSKELSYLDNPNTRALHPLLAPIYISPFTDTRNSLRSHKVMAAIEQSIPRLAKVMSSLFELNKSAAAPFFHKKHNIGVIKGTKTNIDDVLLDLLQQKIRGLNPGPAVSMLYGNGRLRPERIYVIKSRDYLIPFHMSWLDSLYSASHSLPKDDENITVTTSDGQILGEMYRSLPAVPVITAATDKLMYKKDLKEWRQSSVYGSKLADFLDSKVTADVLLYSQLDIITLGLTAPRDITATSEGSVTDVMSPNATFADNPVQLELTTTDMSKSMVWIKNYTSILAEHHWQIGRPKYYAYKEYMIEEYFARKIPEYLNVIPYDTISQKWLMMPYRGKEFFDTVGKFETDPNSRKIRIKRYTDNDIRLIYPKFNSTDIYRLDRISNDMRTALQYVYDAVTKPLVSFVDTYIPVQGTEYLAWYDKYIRPSSPPMIQLLRTPKGSDPYMAKHQALYRATDTYDPSPETKGYHLVYQKLIKPMLANLNGIIDQRDGNSGYDKPVLEALTTTVNTIMTKLKALYDGKQEFGFGSNMMIAELLMHVLVILHNVITYDAIINQIGDRTSKPIKVLKQMNDIYLGSALKPIIQRIPDSMGTGVSPFQAFKDILKPKYEGTETANSSIDTMTMLYNSIDTGELTTDQQNQLRDAWVRWNAAIKGNKEDPATAENLMLAQADIMEIYNSVSNVPEFMYSTYYSLMKYTYMALKGITKTATDAFISAFENIDRSLTEINILNMTNLKGFEDILPNVTGNLKRLAANILTYSVVSNVKMHSLEISNNQAETSYGTTTVTAFGISVTPNIVPIYMGGHENPLPQYLGGGRTNIQLEFITNDMDLLENIIVAATELNVMMRYRSLTKAQNPFAAPKPGKMRMNIPLYDRMLSRINAKLHSALIQNTIESDFVSQMSIAPVYIRNNITMMLGIAAVGITDIAIESIEQHPNTFQVSMNMVSVDPYQYEREVPRLKKTEPDYSYMLQDISRLPVCFWAKDWLTRNPALTLIANAEVTQEQLTGILVYLAMIPNTDELFTALGVEPGSTYGSTMAEMVKSSMASGRLKAGGQKALFIVGAVGIIGIGILAITMLAPVVAAAGVASVGAGAVGLGLLAKAVVVAGVGTIGFGLWQGGFEIAGQGASIFGGTRDSSIRMARFSAAKYQKLLNKRQNSLQIKNFKKDNFPIKTMNASFFMLINLIVMPFLVAIINKKTYDEAVAEVGDSIDILIRAVEQRIDNETGGKYQDLLANGESAAFVDSFIGTPTMQLNANMAALLGTPDETAIGPDVRTPEQMLNSIPLYQSVLGYARIVFADPQQIYSYIYSASHLLKKELPQVLLGLINTLCFYSYSGFLKGFGAIVDKATVADIGEFMKEHYIENDIDQLSVRTFQTQLRDMSNKLLKTIRSDNLGNKLGETGNEANIQYDRLKKINEENAERPTDNKEGLGASSAVVAHRFVDALSSNIQTRLSNNENMRRMSTEELELFEKNEEQLDNAEFLSLIVLCYAGMNDVVMNATDTGSNPNKATAAFANSGNILLFDRPKSKPGDELWVFDRENRKKDKEDVRSPLERFAIDSVTNMATDVNIIAMNAMIAGASTIKQTGTWLTGSKDKKSLSNLDLSSFMFTLPRTLFKLYRHLDTYYSFYLMPLVSHAASLMVTQTDGSLVNGLVEKSAIGRISKEILAGKADLDISVITSGTLQRYITKSLLDDNVADKYNCYADFSIPVLINTRIATAKRLKDILAGGSWEKAALFISSRLSRLAMYTTPDFFIYRENMGMKRSTIALMENIQASMQINQIMDQADAMEGQDDVLDGIKSSLQGITSAWQGSNYDSQISMAKSVHMRMGSEMMKEQIKLKEEVAALADEIWNYIPKKNNKDNLEVKAQLQMLTQVSDPSSVMNNPLLFDSLLEDNNGLNKLERPVKPMQAFDTQLSTVMKSMQFTTAKNDSADAYRDSLNYAPEIMARINQIRTRQVQLVNKFAVMNRVQKLIGGKGWGGMSGLRGVDKELLDTVINPSGAAFNTNSFDIMYSRMIKAMYMNPRSAASNSLLSTIPAFKIYIIEEDNKEMLLFNDFYAYNAVQSIKVHRSRKGPVAVATIILSNAYGHLTNYIAGRNQLENPFSLAGGDDENISSLMLNVGAMIQIRMGFASYLGPETIVFSGEITEIQGDQVLTITCQGWGAQLTTPIGAGAGKQFGGLVDIFKKTNKILGLITELFEMAGPMRFIGTRSPFLGALYANRQDTREFSGLISSIKTESVFGLLRNITGLTNQFTDTRLTNIYLRETDIGMLAQHKSKWIVHQETLWEALYDLTLQFSGKIFDVRPFDEEETIVIDDENGVYQYTLENFLETQKVYPTMMKLKEAQNYIYLAVPVLNGIIRKEYKYMVNRILLPHEEIDDEAVLSNMPILSMLLTTFTSIQAGLNMSENGPGVKDIINPKNLIDYIVADQRQPTADTLARMRYIYENVKLVDELTMENDSSSYRELLRMKPRDTANYALIGYCLGKAYIQTCQILAARIATAVPGFRPVSQTHLKTGAKDIINNDIRLQSGYNRVELSFMKEGMLGQIGSFLQMPMLATIIGMPSIGVDTINTPSVRRSIRISVSNTLRYNALRTYSTFQKNAAIRETLATDTVYAVANGILANLIRDYYGGTLTVSLDPTIMPNDQVLIYDDVRDMWGIIGVKDVTHTIDRMTGAVTIITPDVVAKMRIDNTKFRYTGATYGARVGMYLMEPILFGLSMFLGGKVAKLAINGLASIFKPLGNLISKASLASFAKSLAVLGSKGDDKAATRLIDKAIENIEKQAKYLNAGSVDKIIRADMRSLAKAVDAIDDKIIAQSATSTSTTLSTKLTKSTEGADLSKAIEELTTKYKKELIPDINAIRTGGKARAKEAKRLADVADNIYEELVQKRAIVKGASDDIIATQKKELLGTLQSDLMTRAISIAETGNYGKFVAIPLALTQLLPTKHLNILSPIFANSKHSWRIGAINMAGRLLKMAIYHKIGRTFINAATPLAEAFIFAGGEYMVGKEPILISGLVHKGEPFIGNLEGIKRDRIMNRPEYSYMSKVSQSLFEWMPEAVNTINSTFTKFSREMELQDRQ